MVCVGRSQLTFLVEGSSSTVLVLDEGCSSTFLFEGRSHCILLFGSTKEYNSFLLFALYFLFALILLQCTTRQRGRGRQTHLRHVSEEDVRVLIEDDIVQLEALTCALHREAEVLFEVAGTVAARPAGEREREREREREWNVE